jgi:hypothetical protein
VIRMARMFFGFAIADSMFPTDCRMEKMTINVDHAKDLIARGIESCCNPSHVATISAAKQRFGIEVAIPEKPPQVALLPGDRMIVMSVRGLPRLTDRHEYTDEEVAKATFAFSVYTVYEPVDRPCNCGQAGVFEQHLHTEYCG